MKKIFQGFISLSLVLFLAFTTNINDVQALPDYPINLVIDKHTVETSPVNSAFIMGGVSYIPMDFLTDEFNLDVKSELTYNEKTNEMTGAIVINTKGNVSESQEIRINFDEPTYTIDGIDYPVSATPTVKNSQACIPARTLSTLFNLNIAYSDETHTLYMKSISFDNRLYK